MAGYARIDVEVTDEAAFAEFRERAPAVVEARGGRFLVCGGAMEVVQGDWTPRRHARLRNSAADRQAHRLLRSVRRAVRRLGRPQGFVQGAAVEVVGSSWTTLLIASLKPNRHDGLQTVGQVVSATRRGDRSRRGDGWR